MFQLAVLLLIFSAIFGCRKPPPEQEGVVMIPQRVNIGDVDQIKAEKLTAIFWIHNSSNDKIRLNVGGVPCVCTKLELESEVLYPNTKGKVIMHIDPVNLSGSQTISALVLTDNPSFPSFQPQIAGFFGLPKIRSDYDIDLGTNYASSAIKQAFRIPLDEGIKAEEFLTDDSTKDDFAFSIVQDSGQSFLQVDGRFPAVTGGHQWIGELKILNSDKRPTLKIRATTVSCFDVPPILNFTPSERGSQPTIDFKIRRNHSEQLSKEQNEKYSVTSNLGEKLESLEHRQVEKDLEIRLIAKPDLEIGAFSDDMALKISSKNLGDFDFKISIVGRILKNNSSADDIKDNEAICGF
jgi:hypothetical protein